VRGCRCTSATLLAAVTVTAAVRCIEKYALYC
jgi:hypothetical protein